MTLVTLGLNPLRVTEDILDLLTKFHISEIMGPNLLPTKTKFLVHAIYKRSVRYCTVGNTYYKIHGFLLVGIKRY